MKAIKLTLSTIFEPPSLLRAALTLVSCFVLLTPAKGSPAQVPDIASYIGNPPTYALFSFPTKFTVAEILIAQPSPPQNGQATIRWGRLLAQGSVRLPTNSELQVNLRFDGLEHMNQLQQLNSCRVGCFCASNLDFEDNHMQYLKGFKHLRSLDLIDTLVTDKSLTQIGMFPELGILLLTKTNVTGTGFDSLKSLHKLFDLSLEGIALKPGSIFKLKSLMPQLKLFSITRSSISKADAAILKDLKIVQELRLGDNRNIDDDCVKYLSSLKKLRSLDINDTSITDKSIPLLLKLPSLHQVKVRDRTFWKSKVHKTRYGQVEFVDIERFSGAPAEVFEPLH